MSTLATLVVRLKADTGDFSKGMKHAEGAVKRASATMKKTGLAMTAGITAPLTGIAVAAIRAGESLDRGMANVASLGVATERVQELKSGVQDLAIATGKSSSDMAEGLYQVVSAFGDSADTMGILEINAKAAAAGLATTTDAINLTSAVMKGYGDVSTLAAQKTADLALTTVQLGQTTFPELAASMGKVVPIAANLGVSQEELFATMATLTGVTGSAAEVSTQLRGAMQALMAPTTATQQLMARLGYDSGQAMIQQLGLQGAINALTTAADASGQPLQKFMGSIEGQTLALALAGPQAEVYKQKLTAMGLAAGATDAAFAAQTEGINANGFAMQQAKVQMEVFSQQIYAGLMPALTALIAALQPVIAWLTQMSDKFAGMDPQMQLVVVGIAAVAAALGPLLMGLGMMLPALSAVGTAIEAVVAVLSGPVLLVIAAVVAAIALLTLAWKNNWGDIQGKTQAAITFIQGIIHAGLALIQGWWDEHGAAIIAAATQLYDTVMAAVQTAMAWISEQVSAALGAIQAWWDEHGANVMTIVDAFMRVVQTVFGTALEVIQAVVTTVLGVIQGVWDAHEATILGIINNMWEGIKLVFATVLDVIGGLVDAAAALIRGDWQRFGEAMQGIAEDLWNMIRELFEFGSKNIVALTNMMKDMALGAWQRLKRGAIEAMTAMTSRVTSVITGLRDKILGILRGMANGATAAGAGMVRALADGITGALHNAIDRARRLAQELRDLLPGSDAKTGPLSDLTASGRAFGVTLAKGIGLGADDAIKAAAGMAGGMAGGLAAPPAPPAGGGRPGGEEVGRQYVINVYNPQGEPTEQSILRQMRILGAIGVA